jgi:hypothetical protein
VELPPVAPETERWARALCVADGTKPDKIIGYPAAPRWRSYVSYAALAVKARDVIATEDASQAHLPSDGEGGAKAQPTEPNSSPDLTREEQAGGGELERLRAENARLRDVLETRGLRQAYCDGYEASVRTAASIRIHATWGPKATAQFGLEHGLETVRDTLRRQFDRLKAAAPQSPSGGLTKERLADVLDTVFGSCVAHFLGEHTELGEERAGPLRREAMLNGASKVLALVSPPPADLVGELVRALKEQVGECFDPGCEMCHRHEEVIAKFDALAAQAEARANG